MITIIIGSSVQRYVEYSELETRVCLSLSAEVESATIALFRSAPVFSD